MSTVTPVDEPIAEVGELQRRRREALEQSAWGERFTFVQPRNLCFWVYVVLVGYGVVAFVSGFDGPFHYYTEAFIAAGVAGLVFTLFWAWVIRRFDRYERQPVTLLLTGFFWGGLAGTFVIALPANQALMSLYTKAFGQVWAADWQAGLAAPFVEETAKAAGFLLLIGLAPRLVRTVNDGLILGAFIGLGFQTFEDFLYATNSAQGSFGTAQVSGVTGGIVTRFISDVVSHPLFTALFCAGLVYLIGTVVQPRRVGRGIGLVLAAVLSHMVWDSAIALGGGGPGVSLVLFADFVLSLLALWLAFRLAAPREGRFVHDILAPEVQAGVLSPAELEALTDRKSRKGFLRGSERRKEKRKRKHILRAALDLCHDLAASKGADTPEVVAARGEVARLRRR